MARQALIHLPALMQDAWGIPRSSARMMIAKGSVALDGRTIGLDECDMEPHRGHTLTAKGYGHALLTGDCASRPTPVVNCPEDQLLLGGI